MTSRSTSPSEGEIVESDSDKATTTLHKVNGTSVNPLSRSRVSVSQSPSPVPSPQRQKSRSKSRSPYREPRGSKRFVEDDHYHERSRDDPRRFIVRYEERGYEDRRRPNKSWDLDRARGSETRLSFDDRSKKPRDKRLKVRSRSPPYSRLGRPDQAGRSGTDKGGRYDGYRDGSGRNGYGEGRSRPSLEQSVSDRGHSPVAAAYRWQNAETKPDQKTHSDVDQKNDGKATAKISQRTDNHTQDTQQMIESSPVDEATLIEERRKKREAIKAKHRGHATPLLVQALALDNKSAPNSPKLEILDDKSLAPVSIGTSPPATPKESAGQESPTALVVLNEGNLANSRSGPNEGMQGDEPSAADYDPTMDMQEDRIRQDNRQQEEVRSSAYKETVLIRQDVLLPEAAAQEPAEKEAKEEFDMFADADDIDMFAEVPVLPEPGQEAAKAVPVLQSKALDMSMLDDWDDVDGYYKVILGELLDNRYHVQSNLGKGMFSSVVRATDQETAKPVAIKLIRNNESMRKAGLKEIEILQKLSYADPDDKKHVIRLERVFEHKSHLCMVFENLSINLREVLKKFGRDVGINLKAVRAYAQQMFLGLSLLRKCNILHADLKPDNVLVNESRNLLKICDLGSASDASDNEITPYLVSRFYRAPEIILGMPYDFGIDVWSVGCTLFELFTGKILFTGRSNNQMLRAIMECRGKFSHKVLRKAEFARQNFDDLLNFRSIERDKLTGKDVVRVLNFTKPTRDLRSRLLINARGMNDVEIKELNLFIDLLDRCLNLNPEKRCTPAEALRHPFITRPKV